MSILERLYQTMPNDFSEIITYSNSENVLEKDIKTLISKGLYRPSYAEFIQPYLEQEVQNFMSFFNGDVPFNLTIDYIGSICNKNMKPCSKKIETFLKEHNIGDITEQKRFKSNILNECFGSGFICSYKANGAKPERVYFYDMVENPFNTVYTLAHELTHAMQDKNHYQIYGLTDEKYLRDYKEIHANLSAGTFLMVKALQTQNPEIIRATQEKLLAMSCKMSNVMKNPDLGIRYFDWKGLKSVISDLPNHYKEMLTTDGKINWNSLYDYTSRKVEEMDYNPLKVQETKKFLAERISPHWGKGTNNSDFYESIKKAPKTDEIFQDFCDGFDYFIKHPKTTLQKVEQFYQKLANPIRRQQQLSAAYHDFIPHIEEYREMAKTTLKSSEKNSR